MPAQVIGLSSLALRYPRAGHAGASGRIRRPGGLLVMDRVFYGAEGETRADAGDGKPAAHDAGWSFSQARRGMPGAVAVQAL